MPGRKFTGGSVTYRYGFNGKEEDDEVKGDGNQQDYGMRVYDGRLGRFLSNDPLSKSFPYYSPYHFAACNPIRNLDLDGGEPLDFRENWVKMTVVDAKTGVEARSAIDMFGRDYQVIYDKITKKAWFIHEGNNGEYNYWEHNPGANQQQYLISNSGKKDNGQWKSFETANQIWQRNLIASHDDFEMLMVGSIVVPIAAMEMAAVSPALWAWYAEGGHTVVSAALGDSEAAWGTIGGSTLVGGSGVVAYELASREDAVAIEILADETFVVRGGTCKAAQFENGSGVTLDAGGKLQDVSVNSMNNLSVKELSKSIPNNQIGVTTVGQIKQSGGSVISSPTSKNPNHATLNGIAPQEAEKLFNPTINNPAKKE